MPRRPVAGIVPDSQQIPVRGDRCVRQFWVWDGERWRRLDYAFPDPAIGTEFDGWAIHGTRQAFQEDRARDRRLQIRGWRVLHYTAEDVICRPQQVLAEIWEAVWAKKRE